MISSTFYFLVDSRKLAQTFCQRYSTWSNFVTKVLHSIYLNICLLRLCLTPWHFPEYELYLKKIKLTDLVRWRRGWRCWRWRWGFAWRGKTCTWIPAGPNAEAKPHKTEKNRFIYFWQRTMRCTQFGNPREDPWDRGC